MRYMTSLKKIHIPAVNNVEHEHRLALVILMNKILGAGSTFSSRVNHSCRVTFSYETCKQTKNLHTSCIDFWPNKMHASFKQFK